MENYTPTNMGKLVANHQIKFIHGRSHAELEVDVNKWLTASLGKYEIKEIKLDFSQSGAWLAMIHYYEHVRIDKVEDVKTDRKNNPATIPAGTKHVAPSENTPMSHNTKPSTPPYANLIKNEIDNIKPIPEAKPINVMSAPVEERPTIQDLISPESNIDRGDLSQEEIDGK